APAPPDGARIRGQDGAEAKAAWGGPTLDVNHSVDGNPEDLNRSQLEELEVTLERPAAELPETEVPPGNPAGQFVEVPGSQRLQKHDPSPGATFNRRGLQFFDLIVPMPEVA